MGTPTRDRRAQILIAAADLFAGRGYHGVSIGELGAAVGLTGPALYRHFRGKDDLLAEILLDISARLHDEGVRRAAHSADPLDALLEWHIAFALGNPSLITVHERELDNVPAARRREVRRLQRAYVEEWVRVVGALNPRPEDLTRAAVHAVFGLLNSTPYSAVALDPAAMAPLLHGMARAALLSRGGAGKGADMRDSRDDEYYDGGLDPADSLATDDLAADELDEGIIPPDHWSPAQGYGDTADEQLAGESHDQQLEAEEADPVLREIGEEGEEDVRE